jgi:hypothetical protein
MMTENAAAKPRPRTRWKLPFVSDAIIIFWGKRNGIILRENAVDVKSKLLAVSY